MYQLDRENKTKCYYIKFLVDGIGDKIGFVVLLFVGYVVGLLVFNGVTPGDAKTVTCGFAFFASANASRV
mgnify:CR=1 FL=1